MEDFVNMRITSHGWECMIAVFAYAQDVPAPSAEVMRKMSYMQKMLLGKRLAKSMDQDDPVQSARAAEMMQRLLPELGATD